MQLRNHRAGFTVKTVLSGRARSTCARRHITQSALPAFLAASAAHAGTAPGIVPDGGTHTNVRTSGNGRRTVSTSPSACGVSRHTYSKFIVTQADATLDNPSADARVIVDQATSTNTSSIPGEIRVLGSRANLVLVNPSGITVNGGSFVDTGHVAHGREA